MADEYDAFSTPITNVANQTKGAPTANKGSEYDKFSFVVGGKPAPKKGGGFLRDIDRNYLAPAFQAVRENVPGAKYVLGTSREELASDLASPSGFTTSMVKGVPVLGKLVPENERQAEFERRNPVISTAAEMIGGTAATLPFAGAMALKTGTQFLPLASGQAAVGGLTSMADVAAEKGLDTTNKDIITALLYGGASGTIGPMAGKIISPTGRQAWGEFVKHKVETINTLKQAQDMAAARLSSLQKEMQLAMAMGDRIKATRLSARVKAEQVKLEKAKARFNKADEATPAPIPNWATHGMDTALGYGLGHLMAGIPGGLAGSLLTSQFNIPSSHKLIQKAATRPWVQDYLSNQLANNPMNAAILSALGQSGASQMVDY